MPRLRDMREHSESLRGTIEETIHLRPNQRPRPGVQEGLAGRLLDQKNLAAVIVENDSPRAVRRSPAPFFPRGIHRTGVLARQGKRDDQRGGDQPVAMYHLL